MSPPIARSAKRAEDGKKGHAIMRIFIRALAIATAILMSGFLGYLARYLDVSAAAGNLAGHPEPIVVVAMVLGVSALVWPLRRGARDQSPN